MKNAMFRFCSLFMIALSAAALSGCATAIAVQVTKLPRVDTSAVNRIVVEPFEISQDTPDERQIAQDLSRIIGDKVLSTNRFTIIEAEDFLRVKRAGENYADLADAWFAGEINRFSVVDTPYMDEVYDSATKTRVPKPMYRRDVELEFTYRLVRARDGGIMDRLTLAGTETSQSEEVASLTPARDMARAIMDKALANMSRDIAPWSTTERRTLEKDKAKDSRMKDATALVKKGSYRVSRVLASARVASIRRASAWAFGFPVAASRLCISPIASSKLPYNSAVMAAL
jgi:hypothetical protein